jgi:hypothetical protein
MRRPPRVGKREVAMKPPALAPAACDHLVRLLGMLGSAHDGERAAGRLRPKERGLIATLLRWEGDPTEKQLDWLARIYERVS